MRCAADRAVGRTRLCRTEECGCAERPTQKQGIAQYAQDVATTTDPVDQHGPSRAGRLSGRIVTVVIGSLIDVCAVANVPQAAVFSPASDSRVTVTGFGTALALLAVAAWMTVIWVYRSPLLPVLAGGVLAIIGLSYLLLLVAAVAYIRGRPDRTRATAITVATVVIAFLLREVLTPWGSALSWFFGGGVVASDPSGWNIAAVAVAVICLGAAATIVVVSRTRERAERSDHRAAVQLKRAEGLKEETVRQAERERIARDMHDALAHRLSVVSLHAGALESAAGEGDAGRMARTVREQTHAALQDMRGLIGELRSPAEAVAAPPATMRGIGSLIAGIRSSGSPITSLVMIDSGDRAGGLLDSAVYRIVQESLTNAVKHAAGSPIDVYVQVAPAEGVRIRVINPLVPAAAHSVPGGGNGILGIRERVAALGGEAWVGPHDGSFIVDVSLPWQERG